MLELGSPWEGGTTFVWLIHATLGGGLLFNMGSFFAELAQHILIVILLLTHL